MKPHDLAPQQHQPAPNQRPPMDPIAKALFALIAAVFVGTGLLAVLTEYVPPASTRFGMTTGFAGEEAATIGIIAILLGMMPLGVFAKTARRAAVWAGGCAVLAISVLAIDLVA